MNQRIIDAAYAVIHFTKTNPFPVTGSPEFFKLTDLLHDLECKFIEAGISTDFRKSI